MSQPEISERDLITVAEKALQFQRYIFRHTYAVYYLTWAVALSCFALLDPLLSAARFQHSDYIWGAGSATIFILASLLTFRNFGKLRKTSLLRDALKRFKRPRELYYLTIVWWVSLFFLLPLSFSVSAFLGFTVLYLLLLSISLLIYASLREAFVEGIPVEGKVAVITYFLGATASFILQISSLASASWIPWLATSAFWYTCSLYGFRHYRDELRVGNK